ncbi:MAG TPA: phosphoglycerate mutase [Sedimenticola sp.]|nr:phosphoglycerate mutase [Sedimenticola sp.]
MIAALVRHGAYHQLPDTPSAHQPFPLTAEGEAHADEAARAVWVILQEKGWRLLPQIDSSRLLRGWQTATIMAGRLAALQGAPFQVESFDALAERGVGSAANLTIAQIEAVLREDPRFPAPPPDWKADSHYRLPLQGAESLLEAGERVAEHIRRRAAEGHPADTVKLFVGHGAAFRHAAYHLGVLAFEEIARLSMYHGRPVFIEPGPDGRWRRVAGEWKIRGAQREAID